MEANERLLYHFVDDPETAVCKLTSCAWELPRTMKLELGTFQWLHKLVSSDELA